VVAVDRGSVSRGDPEKPPSVCVMNTRVPAGRSTTWPDGIMVAAQVRVRVVSLGMKDKVQRIATLRGSRA
jgi:hypothetical protein